VACRYRPAFADNLGNADLKPPAPSFKDASSVKLLRLCVAFQVGRHIALIDLLF
jgi:hypothetical protein